MPSNSENIPNDDYSSLASYTFGAPSTSARAPLDTEMLSPLSTIPDHEGRSAIDRDRTPRHSVAHPRDEDEDDDEAARRTRSKMRAIDDGGRRPSLPTNLLSDTPSSSQTDDDRLDSHSDSGDEGGALDTDMEFETPVHDGASQHTFGGASGSSHRLWNQREESEESEQERHWESYVVDPAERDEHGGSPVTFAATLNSDDDRVSLSGSSDRGASAPQYAFGRRPSLPIPIRTPQPDAHGFDSADADIIRDREASIATITLRRPSRSVDDDLPSNLGYVPEPGTQPSSEPTTWINNNVWADIDQEYILGANSLVGMSSASRRSSASYVHPLPTPPTQKKGREQRNRKDKGKGKQKAKPSQSCQSCSICII